MDISSSFDRNLHVYNSEALEEIINETIDFFNGTPILPLPPEEKFSGTGVYAIYYKGSFELYKSLSILNESDYVQPIYVGKAVPKGWRQGRVEKNTKDTFKLFNRLKEHSKSIKDANNLDLKDFCCRFMILENASSNLIGLVESMLIRKYRPLWNSCIDGFGNHNPGSGRINQAKSSWDILHPGRPWAKELKGKSPLENDIVEKVKNFLNKI